MVTITVSGPPGSGKSTVARKLSSELGLRYVSAGEIFRQTSVRLGKSLIDLSKDAETDHSIDREIDAMSIEEARTGNVVLEGHLTGWIVPRANLKIYLRAALEVRAERIAKREGIKIDEALLETRIRELSEKERYRRMYGFDLDDLRNFDLAVNTECWGLEALLRMIVDAAKTSVRLKDG